MARTIAPRSPLHGARGHGKRAARSDAFGWLARAGLVARGVIYLVVGILAIKVAVGAGGKTSDQQGALKTIAEQPFGKALLVLMAVGLAGYSIWRLTRAALGHGQEVDDDAKQRLEGLLSGFFYAVLCFTAIKLLAGSGAGGGGAEDEATGGVLGWPAGTWIVGIGGLAIIGAGIDQAIKGVRRKFCEDVRTGQMSAKTRSAYEAVGLFGHLARASVFGLIGAFLIKAALDYDPDKAVALDGALSKVANAPAGPFLLGAVAIGFLGFAAYSLMDSRYRRV
jgi:Domain of Unknown Function (DUF1206)